MNATLKHDLILPKFQQIEIKNFPAQLQTLLTNNKQALAQILAQAYSFSWVNLIRQLEAMDDSVHRLFSPIAHMHAVTSNELLREVYQTCLPMLSEYGTELTQNAQLCRAIKSITTSQAWPKLTIAQQKCINNYLQDFKLAGVDLPKRARNQFKQIQKQLSELSNAFAENVLGATDAWTKPITDEMALAGLPEHAMAGASQAAKQKELSGWLLTLEYPCYDAVMTYAKDPKLRQEMYTAYVTRASVQGSHAQRWNNSKIMDEILSLRHKLASIVGFSNYAEYSLVTKMAKTPEKVLNFLEDLAKQSKPQAHQEYNELCAFAKQYDGIDELAAWDLSYYSEKLRQHQFSLSQEDLRPYFLESNVIAGMFTIVGKLFGIQLQRRTGVQTWHKEVKFFDVYDKNHILSGQLFMDLYARSNKRDGAWMDECINRRRLKDNETQIPVAYLTCNFAGPSAGKPALLSHEEVITLFHEFGHCLHHLLTQVDVAQVAGINGVAWDGVEFPSQFFENWCWQRESLDLIAKHYQTQQPLPDELFNKLDASKHFQSAMQMVRQLELALFDFRIHCRYDPGAEDFIDVTWHQVRDEVAVTPVPAFNRFPNSFSHIFAGGYAAGYYSYKWAEVLACDAFARFEECGIFNSQIGQEFLHQILEQGGSRDPLELFVRFRGRKPQVEALLRHNGIGS